MIAPSALASEKFESLTSIAHPFVEKLTLGFDVHFFDYREDLAPPRKSTETGLIPGFSAAYTHYDLIGPLFAQVGLAFAASSIQYDGSTQSGVPVQGGTPATFLDLMAQVGARLWSYGQGKISERAEIYGGVAYHHWSRGDGQVMSGTQVRGPDETYRRLFLPVGLRFGWNLTRRLAVDLDASLRPTVSGSTVVIGIPGPDGGDLSLRTENRLGYRLELPVGLKVSPDLLFFCAPWFEAWSIGQSPWITVGATRAFSEPSSHTNDFGGRLGVSVRL